MPASGPLAWTGALPPVRAACQTNYPRWRGTRAGRGAWPGGAFGRLAAPIDAAPILERALAT